MRTRSSGNIFLDIGFEPEEAANLALRSSLMIQVRKAVDAMGTTQVVAARRLGITQPRLNQLLKGKIDLFTIDSLVNMLARAGYQTQIRCKRIKSKAIAA